MSRMRNDEEVIGEWIKEGEAFVFYREPGERVCHGIRAARSFLQSFEVFPSNDGKTGFVFAPFRFGEGHPLWLLPLEEEIEVGISRAVCSDEVEAPAPMPFCGRLEDQPSKEYREAFRAFSGALRAGDFQKLVLSRGCTDAFPHGFSWARAFTAACRRYVHSYVYLFHTPQTGFWLGATPEILLVGSKGEYRTVALAGTQFLQEGKLTAPWSEKNIREQAFVTEYIGGCLRERGVRFTLEGPYTATAGELAHLKTDIRFRLSSVEALGGILQALHPTPAVCGLPKEDAFRFILSHEGYDRSYYAGFLGRWEPEGKTALYVNLRCMQCGEGTKKIRLYAGGGILPASVCEEEWMETERKLQTMKYVISKGGTDVFG